METSGDLTLVTELQLTRRAAVDALEAALVSGFDPEQDAPRSRLTTGTGELLLMPATLGELSGAKLLSLTPGNQERDLPAVQGAYLLFEGPGQRPVALLDGAALTDVRTAAVSALAVRHLLPRSCTPAAPTRRARRGSAGACPRRDRAGAPRPRRGHARGPRRRAGRDAGR